MMFPVNALDPKPGPRNIVLGRVTFIPCSPPENCALLFINSRQGEKLIEEFFVDAASGDIYRQRHASYTELTGKWEKAQRNV